MPGTVRSAAIYGIDARQVTVEVEIHQGLPKVVVVGLPDAAVQESRERIRSAIKNSGAHYPLSHITISLSPAEWRKEGAGFDLPVAAALLIASEQLPNVFDRTLIIGELNLAGDVRPTHGVLAIAELAKRLSYRLIVPRANADEAALLDGVEVIPVERLEDLMTLAYSAKAWPQAVRAESKALSSPGWSVWPTIQGQSAAKRAMVIAAAGGHNVLLVGPPGAGKTLLARGLQELLPPLTEAEALTVTKIHSIAGQLRPEQSMVTARPFRQPHHTASVTAVVGGGRIPKPGELSLAHHGVLFLDEFAEFSRDHIEALRQPLEDGVVTVSRVAGTAQFPAAGMLVAAMNPCPCGYLHDRLVPCRCAPGQVRRYQQRISGPILDRFDLFVNVPRVAVSDLRAPATGADPRPSINAARQRQHDRNGTPAQTNSQLRGTTLVATCPIGGPEQALITRAMERMHFSMRAYHRLLRVSRTIADLCGEPNITSAHLAEALQYRPPAGLVELR